MPTTATSSRAEPAEPLAPGAFRSALEEKGTQYYDTHPFHRRMHAGELGEEEIRSWVANRFYYQVSIPVKDAAIMANCPDREVRRSWLSRIVDHDGEHEGEGGIEAWLRLGEAVGLDRDELWSQRRVLPGVRFAVDAYVNFARSAPWREAVCSSLTELFAPSIHQARLRDWPQYYDWIDPEGLQYFRNRISQARRDVEYGLEVTLSSFQNREQQERALDILQFKLDILWTMCDAMHLAYVVGKPPYADAGEGGAVG